MTEEQLINKFEGTRIHIELDLLLELEADLVNSDGEGLRTVQLYIQERRSRIREIQ
tara:strand:- start:15550 stop:15717 length:168 start_codon:yes stop_codon:yes gene_type:complete